MKTDETRTARLIEVNLLRKFAPVYLIGEGGDIRCNEGDVKETILPGIVMLHHEDAAVALEAGVALMTKNTFKGA